MKVIIAGSRNIKSFSIVKSAVDESKFIISEVVSGRAEGVDYLGEQWAIKNGVQIAKFPADWNTHGKAAGHIRNKQMADYADALVAVWDGSSRGTKNMIDNMKKLNKLVFVKII
jgi:hypothetical protein